MKSALGFAWFTLVFLLFARSAWSQSISFTTTTITNMQLELSCKLLPSPDGENRTPVALVSLRNTSATATNALTFFENPLHNFFVHILDSNNNFVTKLRPVVHDRKLHPPTYIALPPLGQKTWEVPIDDVMPDKLNGGVVTNCGVYVGLRCHRGNELVRASVDAQGITITQTGAKAYRFTPDSVKP